VKKRDFSRKIRPTCRKIHVWFNDRFSLTYLWKRWF